MTSRSSTILFKGTNENITGTGTEHEYYDDLKIYVLQSIVFRIRDPVIRTKILQKDPEQTLDQSSQQWHSNKNLCI
jgi:hypothetical protein